MATSILKRNTTPNEKNGSLSLRSIGVSFIANDLALSYFWAARSFVRIQMWAPHTENTSRGYYIITARISSIIKWLFLLLLFVTWYTRALFRHLFLFLFGSRISVVFVFRLDSGGCGIEWERDRDGEIFVRYLIFIMCCERACYNRQRTRDVSMCVKQYFYIIQNKWTHLDLPNKTDTEWERESEKKPFCNEGDSMRVCLRSRKKNVELSKQHRKNMAVSARILCACCSYVVCLERLICGTLTKFQINLICWLPGISPECRMLYLKAYRFFGLTNIGDKRKTNGHKE